MNRKIEFRGKPIIDKARMKFRVDSVTVGQYTGLKDIDGTEICEGDIVQNELREVFAVKYWGSDWSGYGLMQMKEFWHGYLYEYGVLEVIGNIHDNPELLEVE